MLPLSAGEPQRAVVLAGMMAIVSGVVCIAAGLARLGFITDLLSKPIRYGYMNGIALTVLLSQVPSFWDSPSPRTAQCAKRGESSARCSEGTRTTWRSRSAPARSLSYCY